MWSLARQRRKARRSERLRVPSGREPVLGEDEETLVLGLGVAETELGAGSIFGVDVGNAVVVAHDRHSLAAGPAKPARGGAMR